MNQNSGKKVLVLDDSRTIRAVMSSLINNLVPELTVVTGENGLKGLEIVHSSSFSLILTDYDMPHMDGVSFLRAFRSFNKETPVVLVSGNEYPNLPDGFNDSLIKPVNGEQLLGLLKKFVI